MIRIRRFRSADLTPLLELERACFGRDAYPRRFFLELFGNCGDLFFVATTAGRIIGYAVACAGKREAELVSIAVAPEFRRRGVARALARHTFQALRAAGMRRVSLMVRAGNDAAIRFYGTLRFRRIGRVPRYYEDGADALRMQATLD